MKTNLSLEKEGYQFVIDGGLAGIILISLVVALLEIISILWPNLNDVYAPIGTLSVGFVFGMMFCRIAPIWIKNENNKANI